MMTLLADSPVGGGRPYWPANHDEHSYIIYQHIIRMGRHQLLNILAGKKIYNGKRLLGEYFSFWSGR